MNLRILQPSESGKGILVEYDAGYINPKDNRNETLIRESNEMLDHSKPFEFYAVLQKYNTPNRNGRVYPEKILKRESENYRKMIDGLAQKPYFSLVFNSHFMFIDCR